MIFRSRNTNYEVNVHTLRRLLKILGSAQTTRGLAGCVRALDLLALHNVGKA